MSVDVRAPGPILRITGRNSFRYLMHLLRAAGIEDYRHLALVAEQTTEHLRNPRLRRRSSEASEKLLNDWYAGLATGTAPYEIYSRNEYLSELWACWTVYSRRYLCEIESRRHPPPHGIAGEVPHGGLVVDLGNGIGITTAAFTEIFPQAKVVGTNIMDSAQGRICRMLSNEYGFEMHEHPRTIGRQADLAFASEYFEHFEEPVVHAREVVEAIRPRRMIVANAFTARAIGHFDLYRHEGRMVAGKEIGRIFAAAMREMGYEKVKTGLFNDRPSVWELK
jgi:hypothetical protein